MIVNRTQDFLNAVTVQTNETDIEEDNSNYSRSSDTVDEVLQQIANTSSTPEVQACCNGSILDAVVSQEHNKIPIKDCYSLFHSYCQVLAITIQRHYKKIQKVAPKYFAPEPMPDIFVKICLPSHNDEPSTPSPMREAQRNLLDHETMQLLKGFGNEVQKLQKLLKEFTLSDNDTQYQSKVRHYEGMTLWLMDKLQHISELFEEMQTFRYRMKILRKSEKKPTINVSNQSEVQTSDTDVTNGAPHNENNENAPSQPNSSSSNVLPPGFSSAKRWISNTFGSSRADSPSFADTSQVYGDDTDTTHDFPTTRAETQCDERTLEHVVGTNAQQSVEVRKGDLVPANQSTLERTSQGAESLQEQTMLQRNAPLQWRSKAVDEAEQIEHRMHEISTLMRTFATKIFEQHEVLETVYNHTTKSRIDVVSGNQQLNKAVARSGSFRTFVFVFCVIAAFLLVFLDHYSNR